MPKKKPSSKRRSSTHPPFPASLRRIGVALATAGAIAVQTTSCGLQPAAPEPRAPRMTSHTGATVSPRFAACPEFFAGAVSPVVPQQPRLRELCYSLLGPVMTDEDDDS